MRGRSFMAKAPGSDDAVERYAAANAANSDGVVEIVIVILFSNYLF